MRTENLYFNQSFVGYSEKDRINCERFQAVAAALRPYFNSVRKLGNATFNALSALDNEPERYCGIYFCERCGGIYHADYTANTDPGHDYHRQCQPERSVRKYG